jgi:hypothetical protein
MRAIATATRQRTTRDDDVRRRRETTRDGVFERCARTGVDYDARARIRATNDVDGGQRVEDSRERSRAIIPHSR